MERKRKVRRAFLLTAAIYIIINIFLFGLIKAYINTNNIVSRNHLVMASVSECNDITTIRILGKNFEIDKNNNTGTIAKICTYAVMSDKLRICTDIILKTKDIILNHF
ncbi:MAG: hypothetical protein IJX24_07055 [Oscillospiraceae bacterium]|nr:hypothetical protein [Oscillospiraceae bacterium]